MSRRQPKKNNRECTRMDAKKKANPTAAPKVSGVKLAQMNTDKISNVAFASLVHFICVYLRASAVRLYSCPFASIRG